MTDYPTKCPCDSCKFKKQNFAGSPKKCPNFAHFFEVYMDAMDGVLNAENCEKWEASE